MFGGPDFSTVERKFIIVQSNKSWGNFSKDELKLIKFEKVLRKFEKNENFQEKIFNFWAGHNFLLWEI